MSYDPYGAEIDFVEVENQDCSEKEVTQVIHGRQHLMLKEEEQLKYMLAHYF